MNDRELLEAAAKAAGYTMGPDWDCAADGIFINGDGSWSGDEWNPLNDDGDALRLAVALSLFNGLDEAASGIASEVDYDMDPCEATRRAIVHAAAAIGSTS